MGPRPQSAETKVGERFAEQATEVPYALLRVEPDTEVELPLTILAELLEKAKAYHKTKLQIERLEKKQTTRHYEFEELVQEFEGLRGVIDKQEAVVLTVFPQDRDVTWDEGLLKEGLGLLYEDIVRERFEFEIPDRIVKPTGEIVEAEQITAVITDALVEALGVPPEEVALVFSLGRKIDVDERRLKKLESEKRVILPEQARKVGKMVWAVTTRDLKP